MSVPRSTSRTERPQRRSTQPQPPLPDLSGPVVPIPRLEASSPQPASRPRQRPRSPESRQRTPPRLSETAGPDPSAPPDRVRLTIGTILAPHGVRGEFKTRLQTDDPAHLLTIKRLYLGDETTPRTVLGVRLHDGNALIRLQGISSPETVERFRGTPLRIRGTDARPLAANEYFLYQVIGLEVFDESGNRLGQVTDLMETGANYVLIVAPNDGGADILLPSHPDVIVAMDPAAGRIVVRPLTYYGE
jgi:16S rRNA processing protein RimM